MLKGRCALVTGSTRGLGAAIAERLAADGCDIVLNGMGEPTAIDAQRRELEERHGIRAIHHAADLADRHQIDAMVQTAQRAFGRVDIIVNNAVVRHFGPIEKSRPEDWDQAIAVNLSSAYHTTRLLLPAMRERNFGRIVNMSSVYGLFGTIDRVAYVTTKTALIGLTRAVALETATLNITCNAICPGTSPTPAIEERLGIVMDNQGVSREIAAAEYLSTRQPSRRFVSLANVAALAAFLCGPAGADITGAVIPIDGGWSAS
jgi:3-hydroxybutyrate dehydrogenase